MRELSTEEKDDIVKTTTEATAYLARAILTLQRHDLMQRQLDLTAEVLECLGVKTEYSVKGIMEGVNGQTSEDD